MEINDIRVPFEKNRVGIIGEDFDYNKYSVMIPIIERENKPYVLFEVRAKNLRNQPGEISFPGGKIEKGENSLSAAIRETCEELGLIEEDIEVLGNTELLITQHNKIIYPYVGIIRHFSRINPSQEEVDHIFTAPVSHFEENKPIVKQARVVIKPEEELPYKDSNDLEYKFLEGKSNIYFYKYDKYVIWGLTAKILDNFINIIKNPNGQTKLL